MVGIFRMVAKRLVLGLLTLAVVSLIIFIGVELLPGDLAEAILGQAATEETVTAFRRELNLDLPAHERYLVWLWGIVQGDMGRSLANNREISELIAVRFSNTMFLAAVAAAISVPLAVTLGVLAALYRNSFYDRSINVVTLTTISMPEFFVAYILIFFLAVKAGIFPSISNVSPTTEFWDRVYRVVQHAANSSGLPVIDQCNFFEPEFSSNVGPVGTPGRAIRCGEIIFPNSHLASS